MKPVHKCACGADCAWCVGANVARAKFPRAKLPPTHDADTNHECVACFERRAETDPNTTRFDCNFPEEP